MFRWRKSIDIITLFHDTQSPASTRVKTLLSELATEATANSTMGAAPGGGPAGRRRLLSRPEFKLEVVTDAPTATQIASILGYVGNSKLADVVKGATQGGEEGLERAKKLALQNPRLIARPLTVDWMNGRAVAGGNEQDIVDMLNAPAKEE